MGVEGRGPTWVRDEGLHLSMTVSINIGCRGRQRGNIHHMHTYMRYASLAHLHVHVQTIHVHEIYMMVTFSTLYCKWFIQIT